MESHDALVPRARILPFPSPRADAGPHYINTELPLLPLVNYGIPVAYTTEHYVDWPPRSSPI